MQISLRKKIVLFCLLLVPMAPVLFAADPTPKEVETLFAELKYYLNIENAYRPIATKEQSRLSYANKSDKDKKREREDRVSNNTMTQADLEEYARSLCTTTFEEINKKFSHINWSVKKVLKFPFKPPSELGINSWRQLTSWEIDLIGQLYNRANYDFLKQKIELYKKYPMQVRVSVGREIVDERHPLPYLTLVSHDQTSPLKLKIGQKSDANGNRYRTLEYSQHPSHEPLVMPSRTNNYLAFTSLHQTNNKSNLYISLADMKKGNIHYMLGIGELPRCMTFSHNDHYLAVALKTGITLVHNPTKQTASDNQITITDIDDNVAGALGAKKEPLNIPGHGCLFERIQSMKFSPDGRFLAVVSRKSPCIIVLDLAHESFLSLNNGDDFSVDPTQNTSFLKVLVLNRKRKQKQQYQIAWVPHGDTKASSKYHLATFKPKGKKIGVWDIEQDVPKKVLNLEHSLSIIKLLEKGRLLITQPDQKKRRLCVKEVDLFPKDQEPNTINKSPSVHDIRKLGAEDYVAISDDGDFIAIKRYTKRGYSGIDIYYRNKVIATLDLPLKGNYNIKFVRKSATKGQAIITSFFHGESTIKILNLALNGKTPTKKILPNSISYNLQRYDNSSDSTELKVYKGPKMIGWGHFPSRAALDMKNADSCEVYHDNGLLFGYSNKSSKLFIGNLDDTEYSRIISTEALPKGNQRKQVDPKKKDKNPTIVTTAVLLKEDHHDSYGSYSSYNLFWAQKGDKALKWISFRGDDYDNPTVNSLLPKEKKDLEIKKIIEVSKDTIAILYVKQNRRNLGTIALFDINSGPKYFLGKQFNTPQNIKMVGPSFFGSRIDSGMRPIIEPRKHKFLCVEHIGHGVNRRAMTLVDMEKEGVSYILYGTNLVYDQKNKVYIVEQDDSYEFWQFKSDTFTLQKTEKKESLHTITYSPSGEFKVSNDGKQLMVYPLEKTLGEKFIIPLSGKSNTIQFIQRFIFFQSPDRALYVYNLEAPVSRHFNVEETIKTLSSIPQLRKDILKHFSTLQLNATHGTSYFRTVHIMKHITTIDKWWTDYQKKVAPNSSGTERKDKLINALNSSPADQKQAEIMLKTLEIEAQKALSLTNPDLVLQGVKNNIASIQSLLFTRQQLGDELSVNEETRDLTEVTKGQSLQLTKKGHKNIDVFNESFSDLLHDEIYYFLQKKGEEVPNNLNGQGRLAYMLYIKIKYTLLSYNFHWKTNYPRLVAQFDELCKPDKGDESLLTEEVILKKLADSYVLHKWLNLLKPFILPKFENEFVETKPIDSSQKVSTNLRVLGIDKANYKAPTNPKNQAKITVLNNRQETYKGTGQVTDVSLHQDRLYVLRGGYLQSIDLKTGAPKAALHADSKKNAISRMGYLADKGIVAFSQKSAPNKICYVTDVAFHDSRDTTINTIELPNSRIVAIQGGAQKLFLLDDKSMLHCYDFTNTNEPTYTEINPRYRETRIDYKGYDELLLCQDEKYTDMEVLDDDIISVTSKQMATVDDGQYKKKDDKGKVEDQDVIRKVKSLIHLPTNTTIYFPKARLLAMRPDKKRIITAYQGGKLTLWEYDASDNLAMRLKTLSIASPYNKFNILTVTWDPTQKDTIYMLMQAKEKSFVLSYNLANETSNLVEDQLDPTFKGRLLVSAKHKMVITQTHKQVKFTSIDPEVVKKNAYYTTKRVFKKYPKTSIALVSVTLVTVVSAVGYKVLPILYQVLKKTRKMRVKPLISSKKRNKKRKNKQSQWKLKL